MNKEFPNDINRTSSTRLAQVENTIVWSDNSSYGKLRRTYGTDGMGFLVRRAGLACLEVGLFRYRHGEVARSAAFDQCGRLVG